MSTHRRREGYWRVYHLAHTRERDELVRDIVTLVRENEPPRRQRRTKRGRKKVHSWQKLICICLLMVILGYTFRDMQNEVPSLNLPWHEPYPDHSTIHRAYQEIAKEYLDNMLERVSSLCMKEAGWEKGVLAGDSSGVETDRYETVVRTNKRRRRIFEEVRRLFYLKYHIIAILDYLIILKVSVTSYRAADCTTLRSMLKSISLLLSRLCLRCGQGLRC